MRAWFDDKLKYQHVRQLRLPMKLPKVGSFLLTSLMMIPYLNTSTFCSPVCPLLHALFIYNVERVLEGIGRHIRLLEIGLTNRLYVDATGKIVPLLMWCGAYSGAGGKLQPAGHSGPGMVATLPFTPGQTPRPQQYSLAAPRH